MLAGVLAAPIAAQEGVLAQIGLTADAVKQAIGSLLTAGVYNPGLPSAAFKLLPPAARAEAATLGVQWLKTYAGSAEFKQQYTKLRATRKPEPPTFETTPEEELKKQLDEQKAQLEESKQAIASLPPEQRKAMEEVLKKTAAQDTPEMRKQRLDGIRNQRAEETKDHQQRLAEWAKEYPEDPKPLVAKRLREFLTLSADVDFAAKVKSQDGRVVFENPNYQAKSAQWKMCYRAGREATAAARTAVQAWLKELGG